MKFCPACGVENKDKNKYCNKCGNKFPVVAPKIERDEVIAFENEDTSGVRDEVAVFENEETAVIDTMPGVSDFENEETVLLGAEEFREEGTLDTRGEVEEPPKAPDFSYKGEVPVYRDPQNDVEPDTGYIDHLRRLKGLLDDGIINEFEYEQKKQQILGTNKE